MKNKIRILSIVIFTAIYCTAIGLVTKDYTYSNSPNNHYTTQHNLTSDVSSPLFLHTSIAQSSIASINNPTAPHFGKSNTGHWAIGTSIEQIFSAVFSQYLSYWRNTLIPYRKSDILYPFHYFW